MPRNLRLAWRVTHLMAMSNERNLCHDNTCSRTARTRPAPRFAEQKRAARSSIRTAARFRRPALSSDGFRAFASISAIPAPIRSAISPASSGWRGSMRVARLLDVAFILPGTNIRYGIDGIIRLVPVVGDLIASAFSLWLVREARALGAPWHVTARMLANVALEGAVGMVPVAGDAFDVHVPRQYAQHAAAAALDGQAAALIALPDREGRSIACGYADTGLRRVGVRVCRRQPAPARGGGAPAETLRFHRGYGCRSGRSGLRRPADRRHSANPPAIPRSRSEPLRPRCQIADTQNPPASSCGSRRETIRRRCCS